MGVDVFTKSDSIIEQPTRYIFRKVCQYIECYWRNVLTNNRHGSFFSNSNEIMLNKLTKQMTCTLTPLLSSVLNSGIKDGLLTIENPDFYADYIINGSLGALNRSDNSARENIAHNIDYLPQAIANTLKIDLNLLINSEIKKGG